jgi:CRISPR-associated protein Cmr4
MSGEQNHKLKPEKLIFVRAITSVHAGAGSGVEHIDLPIQREQPTKFPIIYGSSFKGSLREHAIKAVWNELTGNCKKVISLSDIDKLIEQLELKNKENQESNLEQETCKSFFVEVLKKEESSIQDCFTEEFCNKIKGLVEIFGSQNNRGKVTFTDLKILLFPVKSLKGVFAYVTCPYVLKRFKEHVSGLIPDLEIPTFSFEKEKFQVYVIKGSDLTLNSNNNGQEYVVLEEFVFEVKTLSNSEAKELSKFFELLKNGSLYEPEKRLVVVSDEVFAFIVQSYTEVVTRVKINPETGTVQEGALWTEEYLPTETVLYSVLFQLEDEQNLNLDKYLPEEVLNLGGNQTIGKGLVKVWYHPNNTASGTSASSGSETSNDGGEEK